MAIVFDEKNQTFYLHTQNTSYALMIYKEKYPTHLYYGPRIKKLGKFDSFMDFPSVGGYMTFQPEHLHMDGSCSDYNLFLEKMPLEYSFYGNPDLRTPSFHAQYQDGSTLTSMKFAGHSIESGKKPLPGLPAVYAENGDEAETLELNFTDSHTGLELTLQYAVLPGYDAITRTVRVKNAGKAPIDLKSIMSLQVDFIGKDFVLTHLDGGWARERQIHSQPLVQGFQGIDSKRGASSHVHNPFLALSVPDANEEYGSVYGFSLVYSGNFLGEAYVSQADHTRVLLGLNPFDFNWRLDPGEDFQAPEAVMVYAQHGFGEMSRRFHRLFRQRLCRGKYRDAERPVLINNWEATYFDFDQEKILKIAQTAKDVGIDMMVLDDGWFGKRDNDDCSLGDWTPHPKKLPQGIAGLAQKINQIGMKFGLWFEPEMVSPDSELFRAHPDWCLHVAGRPMSLARNQLILDLSRADVCNYVIDAVGRVLESGPIDYVKWDMNRNMSEIGSAALPAERQRETAHRYILGLYRILETLTSRFPDVLFESCSGGGGRFDPGMLYYMPQTWTSDNTDAVDRMLIQYGTSMVYPVSSMGAHVSAVPNHQTSRVTPLRTRGNVAMNGQFGYELDLNTLTREELREVAEQIKRYKSIREVIHNGDLYRLCSPFQTNFMVLQYISQDQKTVLLCHCCIGGRPSAMPPVQLVHLQNLDPAGTYVLEETGEEFGGDQLMYLGLHHTPYADTRDYASHIYVFHKK